MTENNSSINWIDSAMVLLAAVTGKVKSEAMGAVIRMFHSPWDIQVRVLGVLVGKLWTPRMHLHFAV